MSIVYADGMTVADVNADGKSAECRPCHFYPRTTWTYYNADMYGDGTTAAAPAADADANGDDDGDNVVTDCGAECAALHYNDSSTRRTDYRFA